MNGAALITGAGTRIGRQIALSLAEQGVNIVVHYSTSVKEAEEVIDEAKLFGVKAFPVKANLLNDNEVKSVVSSAVSQLKQPLDILVNNASIFEYDNMETVSIESWDRHMGSNLKAPLFLMQAFAKQIGPTKQDDLGENMSTGNIVNIVDQRVLKKTPEFLTYTLAKMGLWSLTQTAAQALAPRIRVNAIGPGPTLKGYRQTDDHFNKQRKSTILERGASANEIAEALKFILRTSSITGQLICIDGGQHLAWKTIDMLGAE